MSTNLKPKVLLIGVEAQLDLKVRALLDQVDFTVLGDGDAYLSQFDGFSPQTHFMAICGPTISDLPPAELAQGLKVQLPGQPVLFVCSEKYELTDKVLIKNGFDRTFFMPLDQQLLERVLRRLQGDFLGLELKNLMSVPLEDLNPDLKLEFDVMVFLPANKKHVRLFKAGSMIRPEMLVKLNEQGNRVVFINENDLAKFERCRQHSTTNRLSVSEKHKSVQEEIRGIFRDLLGSTESSFETGRAHYKKAVEIVGDLVSNRAVEESLSEVFKNIGREAGDIYSQSLRIATYASLFALATKAGKPEDLAVAGLFHHVGLGRCPAEILAKPWSSMNPTEREIFSRHPEESLRICLLKKIVLVPEVQAAIAQHHERLDGSGFPNRLPAEKISPQAQILTIASLFDALTTIQAGRKVLTIFEALNEIETENGISRPFVRGIRQALTICADKMKTA